MNTFDALQRSIVDPIAAPFVGWMQLNQPQFELSHYRVEIQYPELISLEFRSQDSFSIVVQVIEPVKHDNARIIMRKLYPSGMVLKHTETIARTQPPLVIEGEENGKHAETVRDLVVASIGKIAHIMRKLLEDISPSSPGIVLKTLHLINNTLSITVEVGDPNHRVNFLLSANTHRCGIPVEIRVYTPENAGNEAVLRTYVSNISENTVEFGDKNTLSFIRENVRSLKAHATKNTYLYEGKMPVCPMEGCGGTLHETCVLRTSTAICDVRIGECQTCKQKFVFLDTIDARVASLIR